MQVELGKVRCYYTYVQNYYCVEVVVCRVLPFGVYISCILTAQC